jgi:hypothetical protein
MTPKLKRALQEEGYYNHIIKLLSDPVSPTGIHMNRNFKKYNSGWTPAELAAIYVFDYENCLKVLNRTPVGIKTMQTGQQRDHDLYIFTGNCRFISDMRKLRDILGIENLNTKQMTWWKKALIRESTTI